MMNTKNGDRLRLGRGLGYVVGTVAVQTALAFTPLNVAAQNRVTEEDRQREVFKATIVYNYRVSGDPSFLVEQAHLANEISQGVPGDDALESTIERRSSLRRDMRTVAEANWALDESFHVYGEAAARTATAVAARFPVASFLTPGTPLLGVFRAGAQFYEDRNESDEVAQAARRVREAREQAENIVKDPTTLDAMIELYRNNQGYRDGYDLLSGEAMRGVSPTSPVKEMIELNPAFAADRTIREIVEKADDLEAVLENHAAMLQGVVDDIGRTSEELGQARAEATAFFREQRERWAVVERARNKQRIAAVERRNAENLRASLTLASTFIGIGLGDERTARRFQATTSAVLDLKDAFDAYRNTELGANTDLAALALSANIVSVGLTVASALMDAGPTPEQQILEEIHELRRDLAQMRQEMHQRFDGVHAHLDFIYERMGSWFGELVDGQGMILNELGRVQRTLLEMRADVRVIRGLQLDNQVLLVELFRQLQEERREADFGECRLSPEDLVAGLSAERFDQCLDILHRLEKGLSDFQLRRDRMTADTWANLLQGRPSRWARASLDEFRELSRVVRGDEAKDLPRQVVGVESWLAVLAEHEEFVSNYPQFAGTAPARRRIADFMKAMSAHRDRLVDYALAVRAELLTFAGGTRSGVFAELFDRERETIGSKVLPEVRRLLLEYYLATENEEMEHNVALCADLVIRDREMASGCSTVLGKRLEMSGEGVLLDVMNTREFKAQELALAIAGSHIRAWMDLALQDVVGVSRVVTDVVTGRVGFSSGRELAGRLVQAVLCPGWASVPDQRTDDDGCLNYGVKWVGADLEHALRSPAARDAALYGFGYRALAEARLQRVEGGEESAR